MNYDELAEIHSDLEWALFELRIRLGGDLSAIERAEAALARLGAIVAALAGDGDHVPTGPSH
jgi:hypothetical protein